MSYSVPFAQLDKGDIPLAGGKGANLGELSSAGFPVPPGFVLTTAAYDAFVAANELQATIISLANSVSPTDPQTGEAAANQIRQLFQNGNLSDDLASAISSAYAALKGERDLAVAVRSSATAEDLPTASFAGQQDTYLNIHGEAALIEAIKNCWASLWTARAISYRQRQEIAPDMVSLAVVVQTLVAADSAGILFTANPVTGNRDEILINATWGLGEAIVGGLVTPDTLIVAKGSGTIQHREIAAKTMMTVRLETGTEEQAVPESLQDRPVLNDATISDLARFGEQIEAHYNMPMDIEWAIADGQIAILQARPITSLPTPKAAPPADIKWEPIAPDTLWMRRQIVEHMAEPLSPLFEELYLDKGIEESIDELMIAMTGSANTSLRMADMMPHGFTATINGYAYTGASFKMSAKIMWAILKIYARLPKMMRSEAFDFEGYVLPRYQATIALWAELDLSEAPSETLLAGIKALATADSRFWWGSAPPLGMSRAFDQAFDRFLRSFLIRRALPEPKPVSATFLRGFDSRALDAQADMETMAALIRKSDTLREIVQAADVTTLRHRLAASEEGEPILEQIDAYLDAYGHQIYNLDFVSPTQRDDPLPFLLSLKALVQSPPEQDVRSRQAEMAAQREILVEETRQNLNPLTRRLFDFAWRWTKAYAPYREAVMFYMGSGWPTIRSLAAELGQRLTDAGVIDEANHIYYLHSEEISRAIQAQASAQPMPDYRTTARDRYALREMRKQLNPLPKVPIDGSLKFGPFKMSMFDPVPEGARNEGPVLQGFAVSTGRITAPASVIRSSEDFDKMQPNTILVCTTTTPAWTPLFSQAVGLVTDVGGALAHGSIVAREYGIPAVMGTGVATDRIKSGMVLEVDGDSGTVKLVEEVG